MGSFFFAIEMKTRAIFVFLFSVVILVGCNSEKRNVEKAAQGYLDAVTNFKTDEARKYAAPDFEQYIEMMEIFVSWAHKDTIAALIPNKVTINNVEIYADTAAIVSFHSSNPRQETDAQIKMIKIDGEWKVVAQGERVE